MSILSDEDELGHSTSSFLWDYLRRAGASSYFLPLSGGADSASTAIIVYQMCTTLYNYVQHGCQEILDKLRIVLRDPEYMPSSAQCICKRVLITGYLGTANSSA